MLENLLNLVKENAGDAIVNNPAIDNQFNDAAIGETSSHIIDGLKNEYSSGNIGGLMGLLNGGVQNIASNPIVGNIISSLAATLGNKFGVDATQAGQMAAKLVPTVISQLTSKINDPNDKSFDLQGIISAFGGGGVGGMIGGLFGKLF